MPFIVLQYGANKLVLSPGHYLYVNKSMQQAKNVRINDIINVDGVDTRITNISYKKYTGIYCTATVNGRISVNGVDCSTYTDVHHILSHIFVQIVRLIFLLFPNEVDKFYKGETDKNSVQLIDGMHKWQYIGGRIDISCNIITIINYSRTFLDMDSNICMDGTSYVCKILE